MGERWGIGDWGTYAFSDEESVAHAGRLAAGDEYPFIAITVDQESGAAYGYAFTPSGIHYVGPAGDDADEDDDGGGGDAAPAKSGAGSSSSGAASSSSRSQTEKGKSS
jgi:hypothetical protein